MERSTPRPFPAIAEGVSGQARRVADSLTHESCHEVYRRRLLHGTDAAIVRKAVRAAVMESLTHPHRTHEDAANAGALEAINAISRIGIETEIFDFGRRGWKARLAEVRANIETGDTAAATLGLCAMIDGIK